MLITTIVVAIKKCLNLFMPIRIAFVDFPLREEGIKMEECTRITVSEREKKLLDLIRKTKCGELKIIVQDSLPIRVQEIKKSFDL